jgi:hypothetical protein
VFVALDGFDVEASPEDARRLVKEDFLRPNQAEDFG